MSITVCGSLTVLGLLALACMQADEAGTSSIESESGGLEPGVGEPGDGVEGTPSITSSMAGGRATGASDGCTTAGSIAGDGPVVDVSAAPLQLPQMEVGRTMADAYLFRAEFGFLQVTVRSDVGGRARVFEQGVAGREVDSWNVQGMEASTETLWLPRGAYAILFEPFSTTTEGVDVSLEASAYEPVECESPTDAPENLGVLGSQPVVRGGYVGRLDERDAFRFQLPEAATLSLALTEARGDLALRLFVDGDPIADSDSIILLIASGAASRSIALPRGAYQLRVSPTVLSEPNNLYTLSASAAEYSVRDLPGDVGAQAQGVQELGAIGVAGTTVGGYLGVLDPLDAYRIELVEAAAIVLRLSDASGAPVARLFRDAPVVDNSEALITVFRDARTTDVLTPGTYQIRVTPSLTADAHAFYTLDMGLAP